jgi:dipeptidase D
VLLWAWVLVFSPGLFASPAPAITDLEPREVWDQFAWICTIPRLSGQEAPLREAICRKAEQHGYSHRTDDAGNLLVTLPASPGCEAQPILVLQSHLDMVGDKRAGSPHDFTRDPIRPRIEGEWLTTGGETTLGADNGIGVAIQLAIMEQKALRHGPLELLFTVDEEGTFSGADGLAPGFFAGKRYINLDSEESHEINIGCAGGQMNTITLPWPAEAVSGKMAVQLDLEGLTGGHSGVDIHHGRGNAIVLLAKVLHDLSRDFSVGLATISGGSSDAAIPAAAQAVITFDASRHSSLHNRIKFWEHRLQRTFRHTDPGLTLKLAIPSPTPRLALPGPAAQKVLDFLARLPHGVRRMSDEMLGLVETSLNPGVVRTATDSLILQVHLQSSRMAHIHGLSRLLGRLTQALQGRMECGSPYLPWPIQKHSTLLQEAQEVHQRLFGRPMKAKAVHAGVECGTIGAKMPDVQMISCGPAIENAHTPRERVHIASVQDFWRFLTAFLAAPEKGSL